MFDHLSFGVRDIARTRRFYDAALAPLGVSCLSVGDDALGYGVDSPRLWLIATDHPVVADGRSGLHVCFTAPTTAAVDAFHAAALAAGGTDNGKPGPRPDYADTYYAAFVTDPDGYRIEAYCDTAG